MSNTRQFGCTFSGMLLACGGYMVAWPEEVAARQKEDHTNPPTAAEVRWTRMVGIALVLSGGILLWATLAGILVGTDDPVLI